MTSIPSLSLWSSIKIPFCLPVKDEKVSTFQREMPQVISMKIPKPIPSEDEIFPPVICRCYEVYKKKNATSLKKSTGNETLTTPEIPVPYDGNDKGDLGDSFLKKNSDSHKENFPHSSSNVFGDVQKTYNDFLSHDFYFENDDFKATADSDGADHLVPFVESMTLEELDKINKNYSMMEERIKKITAKKKKFHRRRGSISIKEMKGKECGFLSEDFHAGSLASKDQWNNSNNNESNEFFYDCELPPIPEMESYTSLSEDPHEENSTKDNKSETETLRLRIREVEDENQELRTQNLLQNRTILEMRNEIVLLRIQMSEMADTSALLTERVRSLTQNISQNPVRSNNDRNVGLITAPPLMAPPPVPPPLPSARIRITPRQVGAGEALTTPLGVSISSPPRHRIKRDTRQGFYRSTRTPYRRLDVPEPGPSSSSTQFISPERPNYFVGLRIIPQFQTSFVCSQNQSSGYSDSASDSSGSDENPQLFKKLKMKLFDVESNLKKAAGLSKDFELLKNSCNFHHQKVPSKRLTFLENYNFALPNTNSKFFFALPRERKNRESTTVLPSTSGNQIRFFRSSNASFNDLNQESTNGLRNASKISDCTQYTFPTIHEGLHHNTTPSDINQTGETTRLRKSKKNIPYSVVNYKTTNDSKLFETAKREMENGQKVQIFAATKLQKNPVQSGRCPDPESLRSSDEASRVRIPRTVLPGEISSDFEQDGFQADESSNCMTSNENSLEKITISESNFQKKNDDGRS